MQPYPGERVWIKGSQVVTGWVKDGTLPRWYAPWDRKFDPLGDENCSGGSPGCDLDPRFPEAKYKDMAYFNGKTMKQEDSLSGLSAGEFWVDTIGQKIYVGTDPTAPGIVVEATAFDHAFLIEKGANNATGSAGSIVRGIGFAHYANFVIGVVVPNVVLENNSFVWNAIGIVDINGRTATDGRYCTVRNNIISYNGHHGLGGIGHTGLLIEGDRCANRKQCGTL